MFVYEYGKCGFKEIGKEFMVICVVNSDRKMRERIETEIEKKRKMEENERRESEKGGREDRAREK